eukprot:scaffold4111_cov132-Isochrysis_galbana.AAC.5
MPMPRPRPRSPIPIRYTLPCPLPHLYTQGFLAAVTPSSSTLLYLLNPLPPVHTSAVLFTPSAVWLLPTAPDIARRHARLPTLASRRLCPPGHRSPFTRRRCPLARRLPAVTFSRPLASLPTIARSRPLAAVCALAAPLPVPPLRALALLDLARRGPQVLNHLCVLGQPRPRHDLKRHRRAPHGLCTLGEPPRRLGGVDFVLHADETNRRVARIGHAVVHVVHRGNLVEQRRDLTPQRLDVAPPRYSRHAHHPPGNASRGRLRRLLRLALAAGGLGGTLVHPGPGLLVHTLLHLPLALGHHTQRREAVGGRCAVHGRDRRRRVLLLVILDEGEAQRVARGAARQRHEGHAPVRRKQLLQRLDGAAGRKVLCVYRPRQRGVVRWQGRGAADGAAILGHSKPADRSQSACNDRLIRRQRRHQVEGGERRDGHVAGAFRAGEPQEEAIAPEVGLGKVEGQLADEAFGQRLRGGSGAGCRHGGREDGPRGRGPGRARPHRE